MIVRVRVFFVVDIKVLAMYFSIIVVESILFFSFFSEFAYSPSISSVALGCHSILYN